MVEVAETMIQKILGERKVRHNNSAVEVSEGEAQKFRENEQGRLPHGLPSCNTQGRPLTSPGDSIRGRIHLPRQNSAVEFSEFR